MSAVGLLLIFLSSAAICVVAIGTSLLIVGSWKYFEIEKEKVKEMQQLSDNRKAQLERLETLDWWKNTDQDIQLAIIHTPDKKWDGFIEDLIARAPVVGGLEHKRIIRFVTDVGKFGALVNFEVTNLHDGNKAQSYMYWSWRHGRASGAKGQVFVASGGRVVGFVDITSEKFAVGGEATGDLVGGFGEIGEGLLETAVRELKEELKGTVKVSKVVPLGDYFVDVGLTNNCPHLFYAIVDVDSIPSFGESGQADKQEVTSSFTVRPIGEYLEYIAKSKDGMTLAVFAKIVANGHYLGLIA